jgi:hypothetical protein
MAEGMASRILWHFAAADGGRIAANGRKGRRECQIVGQTKIIGKY